VMDTTDPRLLRAEINACSSVLLEVQQDCIAQRKRADGYATALRYVVDALAYINEEADRKACSTVGTLAYSLRQQVITALDGDRIVR
jgi:predicted N-formylglutamate amidohydrolase